MPLERSPLHVLLFIFSSLAATAAATERIPNATTPSPCPSYRCGHAVDIRYPFWIDGGNASSGSHCGYPSLRLECRRETPVLRLPSGDYAVTHILYSDRTVSLFDLGVFSLSNTCPLVGRNLSLPSDSPLSLTARDANLTFFVHCSFVGIPAHLVACLEGDGRHHSYVFRDGDELTPHGYAGLCQDVIGMPVLRRSLLGAGGSSSPLDAVVPALNMGFELSWRPETEGECGQCERAGGLCGRRRGSEHGPWTFACFRAAATPAWIAPKSPTLLPSPATAAAALNTSNPCAPALCGGINITFPFWLAGKHPPECGYKAYQVTCDKGNLTLKNSYWTYQLLDIFYQNSSFRADLSGGLCDSQNFVNASSDLGLSPFKISPKNQELFFLYDCELRGRPRSWTLVNCPSPDDSSVYALLGKNYTPGGTGMPPMNCNVSTIPVLGYEGATGADYQRLLKGGSLLEYTDDEPCKDCTDTGGRCRVNVSDDAFACYCNDAHHSNLFFFEEVIVIL
ncbi:hypothetical protein SETIT_5G093800v2 [Setaria italica]|uniref:Wall-associated receptor kinase galacturonan-binding domain-containing protein n=1 Tax=Setaria italica TaxID=4555 RepID=A0A368R2X6_SETIT|nr:hypothetical protein SETIT_5G093800v2 [Setaria italica]